VQRALTIASDSIGRVCSLAGVITARELLTPLCRSGAKESTLVVGESRYERELERERERERERECERECERERELREVRERRASSVYQSVSERDCIDFSSIPVCGDSGIS